MAVDIELFGHLLPGKPRRKTLTLERSMNVREVAVLLGLLPEEVGLMTINGVQSELDDPVPMDCRLCLFAPMSGG